MFNRAKDMRSPFDVSEIEDDVEDALRLAGTPRPPLLETRQQTHGSFESNAIISQELKSTFRSVPGWARLAEVEREAMDMIAVKFARILSGKSLERQHWEDVDGYARLALEKCLK